MRAVVIFAVLLFASTAVAQHSRADEAKQRYKAGKALFDTGDYPGAIEQYKKSYQLSKLPLLLFNIAQAHRLAGDASEALDSYNRFVDAAPTSPYVKEASRWIRALTKQVKREKEAARREGEAKKKAEEAKRREEEARKRAATAEGQTADAQKETEEARQREAQAKKEVAEARRREHKAQREAEQARKEAANNKTSGAGAVKPATGNGGQGGMSALGYGGIATAGVGLALVGVGGYFGLKAKSSESDINGEDAAWSDSLLDEFDSGEAHERKMWLFTGVGAGLAVVGTALFVYDLVGSDESSERSVSLAPQLGGETTGFALLGRF